jgi:hypothetical protein
MTGKAVLTGLVPRFEITCGVEFGHPRTTIQQEDKFKISKEAPQCDS